MNNNTKILIVDDDYGHATLIKKNLKRAGLENEIIHFSDGEEILNYFYSNDQSNSSKSFYILLLDIKMPKINGFEVLRKLKSDNVFKKIPIIMVTTTSNPEEIESCHLLGCNNYIQKPINHEKFIESIRNLGSFLSILEIPEVMTGK